MAEHVAVIGLGTMGVGIAQVFATGGCRVSCFDNVPEARASARERIAGNLRRMRQAGLLDEVAATSALGRIDVCANEEAAAKGATFVLEAIAEDLPAKQQLVGRLEKVVSPQAIIATNTSSLRLADIAAGARHPGRFVVAHWFHPAHIVPVVEVVPGPETSPETMEFTIDLLRRIGKQPIRLQREVQGFVVNRVQVALLREVLSLLEQGIATAEEIDAAVRGSMGFRLAISGPLAVCDFGGLDIWRNVFQNLLLHVESGTAMPKALLDAVAEGRLGTKWEKGFFDYGEIDLDRIKAERERRMLDLLKILSAEPIAPPT